EELAAEIPEGECPVPPSPDGWIDPHLLELDGRGRPGRRLRLEADDAVFLPQPGSAFLDLRPRAPAERPRVAPHRIDAELLLVRCCAGGEQKLQVAHGRGSQARSPGLGWVPEDEDRLPRTILPRARELRPGLFPELADRRRLP